MARKNTQNQAVETVVNTAEAELQNQATLAEVWSGSFLTRTYSKKRHGTNFAELANEFIETNAGTYRVVLK